jgi:hypothetical protein
MTGKKAWTTKFDRLLQAVAEVEGDEEAITCEQCQEMLDLLAADHLAGEGILQRHLATLLHLARCQQCRTLYLALLDTLLAEREGQLEPLSIPQRPPALWKKEGGSPARPFPLTFHVEREFLHRVLRGPQLASARGQAAANGERSTLLLSDIVMTEQGELIAAVSLHRRIARRKSIDLEVQLISDWELPDNLQVQLCCANLQRSLQLSGDGKACFEGIPLADLMAPSGDPIEFALRLTFTQPT